MGTLFLVATPIGNLEDLSPRAVRTLRSVSLIAAEDTRQTRKLLTHFKIANRLFSYHEHNKEAALAALLEQLSAGDVALVSDAGTPGINDPGYELVRAALAAGHAVSPVPGPSAPLAALIASGLPADRFVYLGYLPRRRTERRALLEEHAVLPHTLILLETPHRLLAALEDVESVLGDRPICVAREMTKLHEEFVRGPCSVVRAHFAGQPPRGEITLVIAGRPETVEVWTEERLQAAIRSGLAAGNSGASLAKQLAAESGWPRREIYDHIRRAAGKNHTGK